VRENPFSKLSPAGMAENQSCPNQPMKRVFLACELVDSTAWRLAEPDVRLSPLFHEALKILRIFPLPGCSKVTDGNSE
jgi:hypothetical protein